MQWNNKLVQVFYVKKCWHMKNVGYCRYFIKLRIFNKKIVLAVYRDWFWEGG